MKKRIECKIPESFWNTEAGQKIAGVMSVDKRAKPVFEEMANALEIGWVE